MRTLYVIFILVLFFHACQKEEKMLSGEILGTVILVDQSNQQLQDQSGVHVSLFRDDLLVQETLTDIQGSFVFEKVEYGKYSIPLQFENYVQSKNNTVEDNLHIVYHVGGYSPTRVSYSLYEVPTWTLSVDSVVQQEGPMGFNVFLKINGDTLPPYPSVNPWSFRIRGYASNSPDVSHENYASRMCGYLEAPNTGRPDYILEGAVYGNISLVFNIWDLSDETKYVRFYPIARGQDQYTMPDNPDALGPPSNVVSFDFHL